MVEEKLGNSGGKSRRKRLVVGISGASGAQLALELLMEIKKLPEWETHLVISQAAQRVIGEETGCCKENIEALAYRSYSPDDIGASIASGTFRTDGMVVVPCSMRTLAAIANGFSYNLLTRAADVTLKEQRPLILVTRESPLSPIHLNNMLSLARLGVVIMPPVMTYYNNLDTIKAMSRHIVGKILDRFAIDTEDFRRWGE